MTDWILYLLVGAVGFWLFFRWFERSNVYQPSRNWWATGSELGGPWEAVEFKAGDGVRLSGWFFPARTNAAFPKITVLISHGNGGNVSHRLTSYQLLLDLGVNVFAYDYRGYGQSEGRPSEPGTYLDAEAALDWLRQRGFDEGHIVALGESLGGGIASELALRHPGLRGLILHSTFTSIPDIGAEMFPLLPVRTLSRIRYATHDKLRQIRTPVLILHSRTDTLIAFRHAERNFESAQSPKWLREIHGDHNDQPDASPQVYTDAIREFLIATAPAKPTP